MRAMTLAVLLSALGCGGSGAADAPDLTGIYTITYHTLSEAVSGGAPATCAGEGAAMTTTPFLQLTVSDEGFGRELEWGLCDTTDPTTCSTEFFRLNDVGGAWDLGAATSASYSGGLCSLFHAEGTVTANEDGTVRLEIKEWNDYPPAGPESECTSDAAAALVDRDETCTEHRVVVTAPL